MRPTKEKIGEILWKWYAEVNMDNYNVETTNQINSRWSLFRVLDLLIANGEAD